MHRTRTIVKLLACVAVTALSGCVSVQPHPATPPRPATGRPAGDLAPQIGRPPVRDTLEALPDPKPSHSAADGRTPAASPAAPQTGPRVPPAHDHAATPRPRRAVPATPPV
ncbi:hypothetical protein ACFWNU_29625, partial [Streptomyces sp. NPDC058427]